METIRNYLEAMFASMPNTPEVWKAKNELFQMMEDKYNELVAEGKSDNEAVGTVIAEFGNLDELALDLGIEKVVQEEPQIERRMVYLDEVQKFITDRRKRALNIALGVFLCIISVVCPIVTGSLHIIDAVGVSLMFMCIIAGVVLFVYAGAFMKPWDFIKKQPCAINFETANYLKLELDRSRSSYLAQRTIGICLCVVCWIPSMLIDTMQEFGGLVDRSVRYLSSDITDGIGGSLIFLIVGIGVFLIIYSKSQENSYEILLKLNDQNTISGSYSKSEEKEEYISPAAETIMSIYWPTVTCLYLIWSFCTFEWWRTWIIWPVAGIIHAVIKHNLIVKK